MLKTYDCRYLRALLTPLHTHWLWVIAILFVLILPQKIQAREKLTISLKDTTVVAIIDQIRNQTDIDFIYNQELLEQCPKVSIEVSKATVEEVLNLCLQQSGLTFRKMNNTIIIIPIDEPDPNLLKSKAKGKLRGKVMDADSRVALPFATVLIESSDGVRGASTDENGLFRFDKIPVGRHALRVSFIGYEEKIVNEIFVGSSREIEVQVAIIEKVDSLGEVAVGVEKGIPLNQMAMVSSRSFSVEETKRYAASINDPARMALVFAGVTGNDDSSNEIVIRGNSPNWMQWRLEGVEIPSPNHLSEEGFTSGAVSIISSDMLATSDFYMGAFPAEFGNALSGVFDLRFRNGNNENHQFSAQAGILGLDFSAEGPFKKGYKSSYLVNYRYSTLALLDKVNIHIAENALPIYQDLSFKFNFPTPKAGTFSLWAISGNSEVNEESLPILSASENLQIGYRDFTRSGMYVTGLTHTIFPDHKSYLRTVISNSFNYSSQTYETAQNIGDLKLNFEDKLRNDAIRVTTLYNRKVSQQLTLRMGATLNNIGYSYTSILTDESGKLSTFLNGKGRTNLFQSYIQGKYRITERLSTTMGLHYAYFSLSNDRSLEPRLGLLMNLNNQQKLSFGFGRHSKNVDLPIYFVENESQSGSKFYPNRNLKMTRANHYIIGYEKNYEKDIQFKSEIYLQKINNLPVPSNPEKYWPPFFGNLYHDTLANIGKSRNMGIELTIQKYFTNKYYLLYTSSLFDAKYKPANGQWFNSKFNFNYASNFVGGKEFDWGTNKQIGLNAKIVWYGGKRLLPLDLDASIDKGTAVYDVSKIFSKKGPDYFRIDLGFNLHFFKEKSEHIISLDIQNATNRRNIYSEEYNPINKSLDYYYLSGLIPILNYRVEF